MRRKLCIDDLTQEDVDELLRIASRRAIATGEPIIIDITPAVRRRCRPARKNP
jgi:hypothetical protein